MAEDNWWAGDAYATAASAKASTLPSVPPGVRSRAKPTAKDMADLSAASSKAQAERDAARQYAATEMAVRTMDTGPWKAQWLDAIMPDEDGGWADGIGSTLGLAVRPLISDRTLEARDHLKTVGAQTSLNGSQQMKGSSTDKDMAIMRMAGVSPYKSKAENLRILNAAKAEGRVSQARALFASSWISKYGSVANAAPRGMTYEQGLAKFERGLSQPSPRPAPPSIRKASGRAVYDLNGNLIR